MGHSILNIEGIAATVFLVITVLRAGPGRRHRKGSGFAPEWVLCGGVAIATFLPFARGLLFPFLHDSYDLVYTANTQTAHDVLRLFYAAADTPDRFYRPLAFLLFWAYAKTAHFHPLPWHALCLAGHMANSVLVYLLARRLTIGQFASVTAGLVFGWHATRPEAVTWVAGRVDVFATLFVLVSLSLALRFMDAGRAWLLGLCGAAGLFAVLTKESGYVLPLLLVALLIFRQERRRAALAVVVLTAVCGMVFAWRWFVLGGIGGYRTASGAPTALDLNPLKTAEGLFYREWAIAFFPINWSERGALVWIGLLLAAILLVTALSFRSGPRAWLTGALLFVILAALPAHQLLLIGADLNGARVLYLPLTGLALFWAVLVDSHEGAGRRIIMAAGLLGSQLCFLEHNLSVWGEVAATSKQVCTSLANDLISEPGPAYVASLPAKRKGVYFLANGFAACVLVNSGGGLTSLPTLTQTPAAGIRRYRWDEASSRLTRDYDVLH